MKTLKKILEALYKRALTFGRDYAHSGTSLDYGDMKPAVEEAIQAIKETAGIGDEDETG